MIEGRSPSSSSASSTTTWAMPRAPPAPRASPISFDFRTGSRRDGGGQTGIECQRTSFRAENFSLGSFFSKNVAAIDRPAGATTVRPDMRGEPARSAMMVLSSGLDVSSMCRRACRASRMGRKQDVAVRLDAVEVAPDSCSKQRSVRDTRPYWTGPAAVAAPKRHEGQRCRRSA